MATGLSIFVFAIAALLWYRWQKSLPHQVTALLKQAEQAHKLGDLAAAEAACLHALVCARRIWLNGRGALVTTLYNLAVLYLEQDKVAQAEQTATKALSVARCMGRKSPISTSLVALLAKIYKKLGKDLSACPAFQLSIPLLRAKYGPDSIQVGAALHELGVTLTRVGVPEKAIEALEECIPIFENRLGKDHHDVG